MGYAIAEAAQVLGADVVLISGPTALSAPVGVKVVNVEFTRQMYDAALSEFADADYVVAAAAVSDYRVSNVGSQKLKKETTIEGIVVEQTEDILAELGRRKNGHVLVGFAAETELLERNAKAKLAAKNLDWIVANDVTKTGAGFDVDTNIVDIYGSNGDALHLPQLSKREVASQLWEIILKGSTDK